MHSVVKHQRLVATAIVLALLMQPISLIANSRCLAGESEQRSASCCGSLASDSADSELGHSVPPIPVGPFELCGTETVSSSTFDVSTAASCCSAKRVDGRCGPNCQCGDNCLCSPADVPAQPAPLPHRNVVPEDQTLASFANRDVNCCDAIRALAISGRSIDEGYRPRSIQVLLNIWQI